MKENSSKAYIVLDKKQHYMYKMTARFLGITFSEMVRKALREYCKTHISEARKKDILEAFKVDLNDLQ